MAAPRPVESQASPPDSRALSGVRFLRAATIRRAADLPVATGADTTAHARILSFDGLVEQAEHVLITFGSNTANPLVRIHSECLTGDSFGSLRCDCGPQLRESFRKVSARGGAVVYLRQEGRGIGLYNKIDAYGLQDSGLDTFAANRALGFAADPRDYAAAAQMLRAAGLTSVDLLSNNPEKAEQLRRYGIEVVRMINTDIHLNPHNTGYLRAKVNAGRHEIDLGGTST